MSIKFNTEEQILKGIITHGVDILEFCLTDADLTKYIDRIHEEKLDYPIPKETIDINEWFMPHEYQTMDIEGFLVDRCPKENHERLMTEITEYRRRKLIPLLRQMKYIVDTLRKNNIVWGVGRGSSVASFVLYLIGVHKINSIYYDLEISEFLR